ncbi:MAG TPA: hypothetical protein VLD18_13155 [Verrucomicrobiae bacterium]|nr:hypothetical protein [Verrucomicrobiae bacterium]
MSGYFKVISKSDDLAVVDIAGWNCHAVALHRRRVERIRRDIEAIQKHVVGGGHQLAQDLWEEFSALLAATERKSDENKGV